MAQADMSDNDTGFYRVDMPPNGWRDLNSFTDDEKRMLRPIAETLAMLDGNAFFEMHGAVSDHYEQYLPEAAALFDANGGLTGWAGGASFALPFRNKS